MQAEAADRARTSWSDNEGCLQQELGATLMVDPNNCVLLLNDLDDPGYVERQRDPKDRRRHIVVITPAGLKALAKAEAQARGARGRSARQPRRRPNASSCTACWRGRWRPGARAIDLVSKAD